MPDKWIQKKVLITVRTYPTPAMRGVEVSCTAGITDDGRWIRLFPIPYRFLGRDQRFKKYQWIDLRVKKAADARPESFNPDLDSIKIISGRLPTTDDWQERKDIVLPLKSHCLCCLAAERDKHGTPTLGLFKPRTIGRLVIEKDSDRWTPDQLARLRQHTIFNTASVRELEKVPYRFRYEFKCDERACPGHCLSCTDWEMGESWRNWRRMYGVQWEEKFRQRFETEMILKYDTHFYVGTLGHYPSTWIIVGLFYPPTL